MLAVVYKRFKVVGHGQHLKTEVIDMSFIIGLLKNSDLKSIKEKLIILYALNVTDCIFTILLVNTGMFMETNLIMAPLVYNNQLLSLIIKIAVPLLLFIWVYGRIKKSATREQLFKANIIITVILAFYGIINISHIVWCILGSYFSYFA